MCWALAIDCCAEGGLCVAGGASEVLETARVLLNFLLVSDIPMVCLQHSLLPVKKKRHLYQVFSLSI